MIDVGNTDNTVSEGTTRRDAAGAGEAGQGSAADSTGPANSADSVAGEGMSDAIARLEALGKAGFTVSIVYGPCGNSGPMYSVNVLTPDFISFYKSFGARDFAHCVEIAETEIRERGGTIS